MLSIDFKSIPVESSERISSPPKYRGGKFPAFTIDTFQTSRFLRSKPLSFSFYKRESFMAHDGF